MWSPLYRIDSVQRTASRNVCVCGCALIIPENQLQLFSTFADVHQNFEMNVERPVTLDRFSTCLEGIFSGLRVDWLNLPFAETTTKFGFLKKGSKWQLTQGCNTGYEDLFLSRKENAWQTGNTRENWKTVWKSQEKNIVRGKVWQCDRETAHLRWSRWVVRNSGLKTVWKGLAPIVMLPWKDKTHSSENKKCANQCTNFSEKKGKTSGQNWNHCYLPHLIQQKRSFQKVVFEKRL